VGGVTIKARYPNKYSNIGNKTNKPNAIIIGSLIIPIVTAFSHSSMIVCLYF